MNKESLSKVFVTGHNGLVGSAVLRLLNYNGYEVITAGRRELDLSNQKQVKEFFEYHKPKTVINCAAEVGGIYKNKSDQFGMLEKNLAIQQNVISNAALYSEKLIFLGSSCVYPKGIRTPIREDDLLCGDLEQTNEGYAIAKIAGIKMVEYLHSIKPGFISVMPCNVYGPGDKFDLLNSHVVPALIRRFIEAKQNKAWFVHVWGDGSPLREFIYVDDLAEAIVSYLLPKKNYEHKIYNIGSGVEVSIKELAQLIAAVVDFNGGISFDASMPNGVKSKLIDSSKIRSLGWKTTTALPIGIRKTVNHYLESIK